MKQKFDSLFWQFVGIMIVGAFCVGMLMTLGGCTSKPKIMRDCEKANSNLFICKDV
jgi:hypothetical protein